VIVTNGIAPQTTMAVMTANPSIGLTNQSWRSKYSRPRCESVQLRTPNS
jgi:hypothetical protein